MGTSAMDTAYACIAMNQEKVENLQSQLEAVKAELAEARGVISGLSDASGALLKNYVKCPQNPHNDPTINYRYLNPLRDWTIKARAFNEKLKRGENG